MTWKHCRFIPALVLALTVVVLVGGCGKYDHLERNLQYVSDGLLRQDAQVSWESVQKTHERWRSSGASHEPGDPAYRAYQDAFMQYAIVYNELLDRKGDSFQGHLRLPSDELPPPPPGVSATSSAGPRDVTPSGDVAAPKARELHDSEPAAPAIRRTPSRGVPIAPPAGDNPFAPPTKTPATKSKKKTGASDQTRSYAVASGDTLRSIAKRFGLSEKSLMQANNITNPDRIAAGQTLAIPGR